MAVVSWLGIPFLISCHIPSCSTIYIGGAFTTVNGQPRAHLAQLNATDGAPTT
jgi:hypothetical protein